MTDGAAVSVRRAVNMTFAAGDPGDMLAPRTEAAPRSAGAAAPASPATASEASLTASATQEETVTGRGSRSTEQRKSAVDEEGAVNPDESAVEVGTAAGAGRAGQDPSAPDDPDGEEEAQGPGGPRKTVLAAASIAGALLIAIPIALVGRTHHSDRHSSGSAAPQGDTVLATQGSAQPGGYTPSSPSASPSHTAHTTAKASAKVKHHSEPKATTGTTAKTTPKAAGHGGTPASSGKKTSPPATAASAVAHLAAAHPGRHICYRAYVADAGWTAPVCDGGVAGAAGKNRPLEAVELSTSGTAGSEANAYMSSGGWQGGGPWKGAVNGKNLVIGTPGSGAGMKAFITKVKSGTVCANTYVSSGVGWQVTQCGSSGGKPDYLFCGLADTTAKLIEAVLFKV
ncbi:hypothetical protein [Streptomyces sp. NPDC001843]|uniref:hypothetical protein n=1 Tax=Streptomyces sp. NPDC001843 TaxID=3364617 RepID=UPI0036AF68C6